MNLKGRKARLTAAVGGLVILLCPLSASAQGTAVDPQPVGHIAAAAVGSIHGIVRDENGAPVNGAFVSALGPMMAFAKTDRTGRFELESLSPGPYLVRAHLTGFIASRGQIVQVPMSGRTISAIALRRSSPASSAPRVLEAGVGLSQNNERPAAEPEPPEAAPANPVASTPVDDHSEMAWRLRHLRRSVLQETTARASAPADGDDPDSGTFGGDSGSASRRALSTRMVSNFFATTPLTGQLNLLTTSSFDSPQQLFSSDNLPRSVAYLSVGAPVGSNAIWNVRGAFTQADISSWIVAGEYATQAPARHRYDIGLSYATQRYDGGNPAALRDVTDGTRNAGAVYGFDTFTISPLVSVTYGTRYARYDYLDRQNLLSPRVALTVSPGGGFRIEALVSKRAIAPGAEEFLPPGDSGIWLPPQRTFSSLTSNRSLGAERTTHVGVAVERDFGTVSTIWVRTYRQQVEDQLVTLFGVDVPGLPPANLGHYFVGNYGDVTATGVGTGIRTEFTKRVHGSVEYSLTRTQWNPGADFDYWIRQLSSPMALRAGQIHDVATSFETDVPETSTRVIVVYRVSNAFARRSGDDERLFDSRFDVQVRQALPFMDFSTAKWEMLLGVRNFFRETAADQSVYDELLVVHPPKRIVGGLTMRF